MFLNNAMCILTRLFSIGLHDKKTSLISNLYLLFLLKAWSRPKSEVIEQVILWGEVKCQQVKAAKLVA